MKHRVYVVASEYSAPLEVLTRTPFEVYQREPQPRAGYNQFRRLFFSAPSENESWTDVGAYRAPTLEDLVASAAHRALGSFHELCGNESYADTLLSITDLLVASMPLLAAKPGMGVNAGLIPLMLRSALGLEYNCRSQFVAGTADSGAGAFATAVRIAQSQPSTILISAGQLIPSGYIGQYRIRSVFTEDEQAQGLDMMAIGDVLMDALRRTYASSGTDLAQCQDWLADVRRCKLAAAAAYPASLGVKGADPAGAAKFVTPYFRSADVAKAGCGAAAVVITSQLDTLARIRRTLHDCPARYRNMPVVEVMGVGEGTTNPRILSRRVPLASGTAIRQALVSAADDGNLPQSVYPDSAFALLHDGFPSMELAVLLSIGLDWQRATLRMTTWWSNPCGGLLAFGDALGASGLVQVCKGFHVFTGDRRYIPEPLTSLRHFRRSGAYAFTASIGGPLSHVVVSVLRGGVPLVARDQAAFFEKPRRMRERRSLATAEHERRARLQRSSNEYIERLYGHNPHLYIIEGVTEVDARSCSQALEPEDIDRLPLGRLALVCTDEAVDECRGQVRTLIHQLRTMVLQATDGAAMYSARYGYNAGLKRLLEEWDKCSMLRSDDEIQENLARASGGYFDTVAGVIVSPDELPDALPEELPDEKTTKTAITLRKISRLKALKQCIRVPMAVLVHADALGRSVRYMASIDGHQRSYLDYADFADFSQFADDRTVSVHADDNLLPWWNSRATRPVGPLELLDRPNAHALVPDDVFDVLMQRRRLDSERPGELGFLRAYFAASGPQAAVDLAMSELGIRTEVAGRERTEELVPAIFYKNDIIGSSVIANIHEAYELLGRAVQRARGWFGMYASTCAQHGDSVSLVSLDRRLEPGGGMDSPSEALHARREAISNASRFARDVAEWCLGYGIRIRTVVSFGQGVPYRDVNDELSVASDSAIRGARLLDHVTAAARDHEYAHLPWIAFDSSELEDIEDAAAIVERELSAVAGAAWIQPPGPPSPVALERWDDVRFAVWYRSGTTLL